MAIPSRKKVGSFIMKSVEERNSRSASPSWIPRTTLCGTHCSMMEKNLPYPRTRKMIPRMRPAAAISPLPIDPAITITATAFIGSRGMGRR